MIMTEAVICPTSFKPGERLIASSKKPHKATSAAARIRTIKGMRSKCGAEKKNLNAKIEDNTNEISIDIPHPRGTALLCIFPGFGRSIILNFLSTIANNGVLKNENAKAKRKTGITLSIHMLIKPPPLPVAWAKKRAPKQINLLQCPLIFSQASTYVTKCYIPATEKKAAYFPPNKRPSYYKSGKPA
jgi:hypothetical protein